MRALATIAFGIALTMLLGGEGYAQSVPPPGSVGSVETFNIVQWSGNQLPPIYERSDELPLTDDEIVKLSAAGFSAPQVVKMIEQRRCRCDASADGLIRLKKAGVDETVIAAVSRHGLRPNRSITLVVTMDFIGRAKVPTAGIGGRVRPPYLYFFVTDGTIVRTYMANIADVLSRGGAVSTDTTDVLRPRPVRRVQLVGEVPLVTYGKHRVTIVASTRPNLVHTSDLSGDEQARAKTYDFDYPRSSLQKRCDLRSSYQQDVLLANRWSFEGAQFVCEWN